MGEPTTPSPIDREARRRFAHDIIESVRNDEEMPLPLQVVPVHGAGEHFRRVDVEQVAFELAQEVDMQREEVERLRSALGWQMRLSDGAIHCEHGTCLATIDLPLIARSAWHVNQAGWWFCPEHSIEESRRG